MDLKELKAKINAGEISEKKLSIMIDNDETYFQVDGDDADVKTSGGYNDVFELYEALFPDADICRA